MSLYSNMRISQSGLEASRMRLEAASSNLANADASAADPTQVYQVQRVIQTTRHQEFKHHLQKLEGRGVRSEIQELSRQTRIEYDPDHPDADANGNVHYPDVDFNEEMAEMVSARRAYQAGLAAYSEAKEMFHNTLDITRGS